jgi:hypothetical protein
MSKNKATEEIPYDPNQMVSLRTEWRNVEIPTETSRRNTAEPSDESTGPASSSPGVTGPTVERTGVVTKADNIISEMNICQETFRQMGLRTLENFPPDSVNVLPNFQQNTMGDDTEPNTGMVAEPDAEFDADAEARAEAGEGPSFVASHPIREAVPTASFGDLKDGIENLGDKIRDLLADFDLEVDFERTDKGGKVRIRNRASEMSEATPTDETEPPRESETTATSKPEVREIHHRLTNGGTVSVLVRPSGPAFATADGDTGSAANNSTVGYINKRTKGLIVNEFGQLYSVINLGLTLQFQIGVEGD